MNGLPRWQGGKESACQCRRCRKHGFDPWVGKIPWSRKQQHSLVFLPRVSHGQRNLVGYSPCGCRVRTRRIWTGWWKVLVTLWSVGPWWINTEWKCAVYSHGCWGSLSVPPRCLLWTKQGRRWPWLERFAEGWPIRRLPKIVPERGLHGDRRVAFLKKQWCHTGRQLSP